MQCDETSVVSDDWWLIPDDWWWWEQVEQINELYESKAIDAMKEDIQIEMSAYSLTMQIYHITRIIVIVIKVIVWN